MDINEFRESVKENIPEILNRNENKEIWIYGAGTGGTIVFDVLTNAGITIKGFIDKKKIDMPYKFGLPVLTIDDIDKEKSFIIIAALDYFLSSQMLTIALGMIGNERRVFCLNYEKRDNESDIEYKGCIVGRYSYDYESFLAMTSFIQVESIGRFCSINKTARFCPNHMWDSVSTYSMHLTPFKNADKYTKSYASWRNYPKVNIGNDVWIGANAVILPHVQIGDGAIVGANAVVTKNVRPYEIVGGVPAKHIRYRFPKKIIEALCRIQWWNWDDETIAAREKDFYDIETFVRLYDV